MSGEPVSSASKHWARLSGEHRELIEQYGLEQCKRRQALQYFNWRYRPEHLHLNDQAAFLGAQTSRRTRFLARRHLLSTHPDWDGMDWSIDERRAYAYFTRLTWAYARRRGDRRVVALREPELGGPLPVFWRRRLISQDLANTALECASIAEALPASPDRVLEIGAGYGRTAHALLSIYPITTYVIVDIEPARTISEWYLTQLFPDREILCLTPEAFAASNFLGFDLAVTISSLHEMTSEQLVGYLDLIDARTAGVAYIKQWTEWANPDDQRVSRFVDYPIPATWGPMFKRACAVQTLFTEAAWHTRP